MPTIVERKVALITGASAGIGMALADVFSRQRNNLILAARRGDRLHEIADELRERDGIDVYVLVADLAAPDGSKGLYAEVQRLDLDVEYLVNNAGFGTYGPFAEIDADRSTDLVRLNVGAVTELSALFLPAMVERGSGRIMNVASMAAFQPGPLMAAYYASKAYVLHFSEALSEELEGSGVTVTALCPGAVQTEFQDVAAMHESGLVAGKRLISVATVAEIGYRAMMNGKPIVIPGFMMNLMAFGVRFAPRRFVAKFVHRMMEERQ